MTPACLRTFRQAPTSSPVTRYVRMPLALVLANISMPGFAVIIYVSWTVSARTDPGYSIVSQ